MGDVAAGLRPTVCFEFRAGSTISSMVLQRGGIEYAIFSADRKCCGVGGTRNLGRRSAFSECVP